MSDLPNRYELEAILAKAVGKEFSAEFKELMDKLGDPPNLSNLPPNFWDGKGMRKTVEPLLLNTFLVSAENYMLELHIGVDWGLVNQSAIDWVSRYAFNFSTEINRTTERALRKAMEVFYRDGLSVKDLARLLEPMFGPVRSEMIAITETTRASTEGLLEINRQIERDNANIKMYDFWLTANDDRVCRICEPRNNQPIKSIGEYPPAHPRCRCGIRSEMVVVE